MSKETAFVKVTEYLVVPKPGWVKQESVTIMEVEVYGELDAAETAMERHRLEAYFVPSDVVVYGRTEKSYRKTEASTGFVRYYKFEEF